nr:MAG TPA: minor structural protein [Caudoviricetes sp.]
MRNVATNGKTMRVELYRNRNEFLYNIPLEWIEKIEYRHDDISKFEIKVPKFIGVDHKINPIYMKILSRQQIVIDDNDRYILMEKKGLTKKHNGDKTFTAYRFQKTLEKKRITIESGNYQLVSDETHIAKGILELALQDTQWTIGYVDSDARIVNQLAPVVETIDLYDNYTKNNVQYDDLLWSKDFNITIPEDKPLYITINYNGVEANKEGIKYGFANVINKFDPFYTGIKHIDAYYVNEVNNRNGVKYVITLQDGVKETVSHVFVNTTGKDLSIEDINLQYETGEYVEQDIIVYPLFDEIDGNVLNLLEQIEEVFECVIDYDTINKVVNVYAKKNVGVSKQPMLSFNSNILEISDAEDSEIPTGIKVIGKDGLSISNENIFGGDIIYNYNYYISNKILSDECVANWNRFVALATVKRDEWDLIKSQISLMGSKKIKLDSEIMSLSNRIKYSKELLSTYIATGDKEAQKQTQLEIDELESKFNSCMQDLDGTNKKIQELNDRTAEISESLNRKTAKDENGLIFTENDLQELDDIDEIITLEDDYYTNANLLYEYAKKELEDKTNPKIDWEMDSINFTKCSKNWKKVITLGDLFLCKSDVEEVIKQEEVRLVGFDYIPKNDVIDKVYFSNKDNLTNKLQKGFGTSARKSSKSYQKVNSYESVWEQSILSNNFVNTMREQGLNLSATQIRSLTSKMLLDFGSYGCFLKDSENQNNCVYLGSSLIAISTDGFKTCKTAIDQNGVIADTIIGKLILGQSLYITDDSGRGFYIGNINSEMKPDNNGEDFGLQIRDMNAQQERIFLGIRDDVATLRLYGKNGELVITENGIIQTYQYIHSNDLDSGNPLEFTHIVDDGVNEIRRVYINVVFQQFRATVKSVSSGGTIGTSSDGGYTSKSTNSGGYTSKTESTRNSGYFSQYTDSKFAKDWQNSTVSVNNNEVRTELFGHRHQVEISLPVHSHEVPIEIPSHAHSFVIENHNHKLDFTHNHNLTHGIYLSSLPSGVKLYVNNQLVSNNVLNNQSIDIQNYLIKGNNKIKFTSTTLGRLQLTVFSKCFVSY